MGGLVWVAWVAWVEPQKAQWRNDRPHKIPKIIFADSWGAAALTSNAASKQDPKRAAALTPNAAGGW